MNQNDNGLSDLFNRIDIDNREKAPKQGRNPVGNLMSPQERAQVLAALAYANEQTGLFPKK